MNETLQHKAPFADFPLGDADQCVKCGLCLPHCPTYKLSLHEGDSPRGRIALLQGLARGDLAPQGNALPHLDGCLVCRACETVCPAQVPYGKLIDAGRQGLWQSEHRPGGMWRSLAFFRRTPARLGWLTLVLRASAVTRLARLVARLPLGRIARASAFVEHPGKSPATGVHGDEDRSVELFLGCIARALDSATLHASIRVLRAIGFAVNVPPGQGCCGAMDSHAGDGTTACELARQNIAAFADNTTVISTASGCGVQLREYGELGVEDGQAFGARVHDVMHFIAAHADALPRLRHATARVVVHAPCTLRNGLRESGALDVLERVEGLDVQSLPHRDCCGAAGSYLFEHAGTADRLGGQLLDAMQDDVPDIFVTSNVGCALHVRRLARKRGWKMRVIHPVELLAESLPDERV